MSTKVITDTQLPGFPLRSRGKVRDVYQVNGNLLMITTDRVSAFDVVLPNGIPDKGKVLNCLSLYWFDRTRAIVPNHVLCKDVSEFPPSLAAFADELRSRSMIVRKLVPIPFECVVRGYLYGSGWKEYLELGSVCGIPLPRGLKMADKLESPLFTPATKAETGHDENTSEAVMAERIGPELTQRLKDVSLRLYLLGSREAESKGIIIADTKFEFGRDPDTGEVFLIDEVLTPDSSRFWPQSSYAPGREQPSYDKQFVREYLEMVSWDKMPPGPRLPPYVVRGTRERYLEAYRTLTGLSEL
ncbi:MAG TPA: phosphoribosylaminoimidazolesuccinocarboxamide synthase [Vicinamibacteria bacterium]|nr:phosphoribosylaminoimidazolesuccinocarboxamide synthase [Vicinamibacteria bacterium]